ncbi:MAG: hypothetical protein AB1531_04425 [Chloroflexota bacterium]
MSTAMTETGNKISAAKRAFEFGALVFLLLGFAHALGIVVDMFRPFLFTPVDPQVKQTMMDATILITDRTSLWKAWLGFNLIHGYGVFFFGLITFLLAHDNFGYVIKHRALFPLVLFMALSYLIMAVVFWFYVPVLGCALGFGGFIVSFVLIRQRLRVGEI